MADEDGLEIYDFAKDKDTSMCLQYLLSKERSVIANSKEVLESEESTEQSQKVIPYPSTYVNRLKVQSFNPSML